MQTISLVHTLLATSPITASGPLPNRTLSAYSQWGFILENDVRYGSTFLQRLDNTNDALLAPAEEG